MLSLASNSHGTGHGASQRPGRERPSYARAREDRRDGAWGPRRPVYTVSISKMDQVRSSPSRILILTSLGLHIEDETHSSRASEPIGQELYKEAFDTL
jgi:hypothetical protein